jgi:hypothetical protein
MNTTRQIYSIEATTGNEIATVRGTSIEDAADIYARRCNRNARAHRQTGHAGLPGVFTAYKPARGGGEISCGDSYVVRAKPL